MVTSHERNPGTDALGCRDAEVPSTPDPWRLAQRAVRAADMMMTAVFDSLRDGALVRDLQGHLIRVNQAYIRLMRFRSHEECMLPLAEIARRYHVRDLQGRVVPFEQWPARRASRGEAGSVVMMELERVEVTGRWIVSFTFAPVFDAFGGVVGTAITVRDVTALQQLRQELERSRQALRGMLAQQDRVQDEERRRIARDLHDDLQQRLSALRLDVQMAQRQLREVWPHRAAGGAADADPSPANAAPLDAELQSHCSRIERGLIVALDATRAIVRDLRPQVLEDLGLTAALDALLGAFKRRTGLGVDLHVIGGETREEALPMAARACLYRVAQECLNNVFKHAQAGFVAVGLDLSDPREAVLQVADDGIGFDESDGVRPGCLGVVGMRERLLALGGTLTVRRLDRGTEVLASVPWVSQGSAGADGDPCGPGDQGDHGDHGDPGGQG
jgi:signal transduction histidine kinase